MKPLCIIITGIDRHISEFDNYTSFMRQRGYDVEGLELNSQHFETEQTFQSFIDSIIPLTINRPNIVIIAHSFGCIASLYLMKHISQKNVILIFFDPTTQARRKYVLLIGGIATKILDSAPKDIVAKTFVFTYTSTSNEVYIQRKKAIEDLWLDKTHPIIISEELPRKTKFIAHDIHRIIPELIIQKFQSIIGSSRSRTRRRKKVSRRF